MSSALLSLYSPIVTVLLSVTNEEERAAKAITGLAKLYSEQDLPFEMLVVENGSVDNTVGLLALLRRKIPELRVHSLPKKLPPGAALREGILIAQGRYILVCNLTDALKLLDKNPKEALSKALQLVESGYELVIAEQSLEEPSLRGFGIDLVSRVKKGLLGPQPEPSVVLLEKRRAIVLSHQLKDSAKGAPELASLAREQKHKIAELIRPSLTLK
jgi:glycosyltransferase involved in cell wall biosynthesis